MPTFVSVKHERRDGLSESRATQRAVEGFESPSVVGGEGPRLGALWRRVQWELDAQHFLELGGDVFQHPHVGEFSNLHPCLIDSSNDAVVLFQVLGEQ
jgi:hypothetical protein